MKPDATSPPPATSQDPATPQERTSPQAPATSSLGLVGRGLIMGCADVIPGVSGGTLALILGIYPAFVRALGSLNVTWAWYVIGWLAGRKGAADAFRKHFFRIHWRFILPLFAGMAVAIVAGSIAVPHLLANHRAKTFGFFFGLILASLPIPIRLISARTPLTWALTAAAAVATFFVVGLAELNTPTGAWFLFVSGAVAISAFMLPGISGSYILLMLGKYESVLGALRERRVAEIAIFVGGLAAGILAFSRVLAYLLAKHMDRTMAVLVGVMAGALRSVWPIQEIAGSSGHKVLYRAVWPAGLDAQAGWALCFALLGAAALMGLDALGRRTGAALNASAA